MLERLVRRTVREMEPYAWEDSTEQVAARHGLRPEDVVRFDLNTSPFPPAVWDAAMEAARAERKPNEYFDTSYAALAAALSDYCGVPPEQLVIGAGADEILDVVCKAFLDNGDVVVISAPTYSVYAIVATQLGATVRAVPLGEGFRQDIDGLLAAARDAKVLFHCNPNSPTGNATPPADLKRLVAEAPCIVAVDEAYAEFAGWSAVPLIAKFPNLVVVKTLSKAFGMAGMRLGYGVAAPEVVAVLNRVRPPNSVSYVTARVAAAAVRDRAGMEEHVRAILAGCEPLAAGLRAAGAHVYPSVTNFLLTRWGGPADAQAIYDKMERQGFVVRNFAHSPLLPGHLRVTVRSAEENAQFLAALRKEDA
ncbi:MAG TPA: histidinol-phosphate transaminase [Thermomicrobiales bacterium]|nr:histidinol-phosphate transaminase [Thermomicrobiales bacterium]